MLKSIFGSDSRLARFSGIVIAGIILDFTLRLIIRMALAAKFGAGVEMDAYLVALAIPVFLMFLINPLRQSIIIVFSEYREGDKESDTDVAISSLFNIIFVVLFIICLFAIFKSKSLISLIAPGFRHNLYLINLTSNLFKILCMVILLCNLIGLLSGIYHSYQRFFVPSFVPVIRSLIILGVVLMLSKKMGIFSLAWGTLIAWIAALSMMFFILFRKEIHYKLVFNLSQPAIKKMVRLLVPLMLVASISQAYILIDRYLASRLPTGSISYLGYAFSIVQFPLFISTSIAIVIFPLLSQYKAGRQLQEFRSTLRQGIKLTAILVISAAAGIGLIRVPLVRLLYERGAFTPQATSATALSLVCYLPWLVAFALSGVFIGAFYALDSIKIPIRIGLIGISVKIILSLILIKYLAYLGLAISSSVALVLNLLFLWIVLRGMGYGEQVVGEGYA